MKKKIKNPLYRHYKIDIRDEKKFKSYLKFKQRIKAIIHTAAQPSHDWAAKEP